MPDLSHALLIATREYLENVRTRGFWVSLLMLPVILAVLSVAPILISDTASESGYAVIDHSGWINSALQHRVLREDLDLIVATVSEMETLPEPLAGLAENLSDPALRAELVDQTAAYLSASRTQSGALTDSTDAAAAARQLGDWWQADPDQLIELNEQISSARYRLVEVPGADVAHLNALVEDEQLLGYFIIPDDPVAKSDGAQYVTQTLTNLDLHRWYSSHATAIVRSRRVREENIAPELADWIEQPVRFSAIRLTDDGAAEADLSDTLTQWAPVVFVYMLWISVFSVTQMLLTNTVEEKSNKLVEVLLSSVSAVDLMTGKILGIAATGLTIVSTWLLLIIAAATAIPGLSGVTVDMLSLATNPVYLSSFLVYFILGYLLYAAILCGLGSLANNLKEAQNLMIPVQLCLFVPLIVMIPIGRDPNGLLAGVLTWIPPFTPFVMMNRAAFPPGLATYVGTTLLMLGSIYLALRIAARVFETGILMTGKPPRFRQLLRLVKNSKSRRTVR